MSVREYFGAKEGQVDLLQTMRKTFLHQAMSFFVGDAVLEMHPSIISDYVNFQDGLEDAVAKATVLPRWLAGVAFLDPVADKRRPLVLRLAASIGAMWDGAANPDADTGKVGCWTAALQDMDVSKLPGFREYVDASDVARKVSLVARPVHGCPRLPLWPPCAAPPRRCAHLPLLRHAQGS